MYCLIGNPLDTNVGNSIFSSKIDYAVEYFDILMIVEPDFLHRCFTQKWGLVQTKIIP